MQHELAEVVVPWAVDRPDVGHAPEAAAQGAVVPRNSGKGPGAAADRPDQDAADQDLLQDLPGRRHVGLEGGRPTAPHMAQAFDLLLLVPEVALVPFEVCHARLGLPPFLLGGLELGHQGVHVVAPGDGLGEPGLRGG